MNTMHRTMVAAACALMFAVGGCSNGGGSAQATAEVRKDAAEGAKREAEARMDATYDREQARKHALDVPGGGAPADAASARGAALTAADAAHVTAVSACDAQSRESQARCRERADSELATAKARAEAAGSAGAGRP